MFGNLRFLTGLTLSVLISVSVTAFAQDDSNAKKAWLDGDSAGPAFALQGEYSGSLDANGFQTKMGVQVIAQGDNKLEWVAFLGGLPGDGWNGEEARRGKGEIDGASGRLLGQSEGNADAAHGELKDGNLAIFLPGNVRVAELAKAQRKSPTLGEAAPAGAVVLFDGSSADQFEGGRLSDDGFLMEGVTSKQKFDSFQLHLEFMTSFMPNARGQGRANSGCYLQGRYEVQILDSFGLTGEDNEAGGIYEISSPSVNMCFPPLTWQTYDIEYHAARFDDSGNKTKDAWVTVKHNGEMIQDKVKLPRATRAAPVKEGPEPGPIYLQNHGNPIRFNNIWVRPLDG
jgi:3-keto-disaccharide hydrolase